MTDDLSWVREQLGPANPVPTPSALTPPTPGLVASLAVSEASALHETGHEDRRRRGTVLAAMVGAAALVAAAFAGLAIGGGGGRGAGVSGSADRVVAAAAAVTEAAHSADVSLSVSGGPAGASVLTAQGAVDLVSGAADFTVVLPGAFGSVEVRSVGSSVYVRLPANVPGFTGGKPWLKADASSLDGLAGQQLGVPGVPGSFDFTGFLNWLRGVSGTVTTVSTTETVHGDLTTHYRATIDLTKAAANAPASVRSKVEQAAQAVQNATGGVPVDVWIDGQGRLRRLQVSYDFSKLVPGAGSAGTALKSGSGAIDVTLELWGFGTPVNVTAPPADQISDLGGLLPGLKRTLVVPRGQGATS